MKFTGLPHKIKLEAQLYRLGTQPHFCIAYVMGWYLNEIKMGILNFIIVLLFNVWLVKDGLKIYFDAYKWKESRWLSVMLWAFATWGIANLIYACL